MKMNNKILSAAIGVFLLSACTNNATGQKDGTELKTHIDSVSYGIGADIGHNLRMQMQGELLDTMNSAALAAGIRDALDSTERISDEKITSLVQDYMLGAQKRMLAKEEAESQANLAAGQAWLAENAKRSGVVTTESGLQYEVLQKGAGAKPGPASMVKVNYRGNLIDGTEFDSSYKRGKPAEFRVDGVIQGWTEGLQLMNAGGRYKFYIPSELGYGPGRGPGGTLPPNSALVFEVELLEVQ